MENLDKKTINQIENEMIGEFNESENQESNQSNFTSNETKKEKVKIPDAIPKYILAGCTYLVYEKRVQSLPKESQDAAREVIKPTENQIKAMGDIVEWLGDRYLQTFLNSPYAAIYSSVGVIAFVEANKYMAFNEIVKMSKGGD